MIKFGTDGWRAVIAKEFTFENVEKVAQAYVHFLKNKIADPRGLTPIPIGFDRRFLSQDFAKAIAGVIAAQGFSVLLSEMYCPTPCISWMTKATQAPGGIMVTASHNPYPWNGVKFKESYGGSASPQLTSQLEEIIRQNEKAGNQPETVDFEKAVRTGRIRVFDPMKDYVRQLRSQIDLARIQRAGWRIAYDPLYGAGAGFLQKTLDMPLHEIHQEANPSFGGLNPEPIDKNLQELMLLVKEKRFDVGLATDGDADRIGAVDENGDFVNSHRIYALILRHLLEKGLRGDIIKTVSTTRMIDRIAAQHGLTIHETPIGFKYICSKFLEVSPLIGGEESGGIGIPSHVYERDGLLCGLLLLEIMATKKKRLGELIKDLFQEIGPFEFEREDVHLPLEGLEKTRETAQALNPSHIGPLKVVQINRMDGIKMYLEDGSWLLLRLSGTEPLLRVYAESSKKELSSKLIQEGKALLFNRPAP